MEYNTFSDLTLYDNANINSMCRRVKTLGVPDYTNSHNMIMMENPILCVA